jgi:hypothetical protein
VRKCIIHGKNHTIVRVGRPENRPEVDHKSMKKQGLGKTKKNRRARTAFSPKQGFWAPRVFPGPSRGTPKGPQNRRDAVQGTPREAQGPSRNRAEISAIFGRFWPPAASQGGGDPRGALGSCLALQRRNGAGLNVYYHLRALTALRCYYASGRAPAPSYGLLLLRIRVVVSSNGAQGGSLPCAAASGRPSPRL